MIALLSRSRDSSSNLHAWDAGAGQGVLLTLLLMACLHAPETHAQESVTFYVRSDGGSHEQCTGRADAAYPGSGSNQPCAWDHPFRALPPADTPRIPGGATLIIGSGSYMMGYGAPGATACEADYPWDCYMSPPPDGPDAANPTRILGAGWDSGCAAPPELWGTERAYQIIDLTGASHVQLACLEITDHAGCVEFHSGAIPCKRDTFPYGPWAHRGIYAADATDVHLRDLNIHGLATTGIHAGRLTDWTVQNVRIAANGLAGWNGDLDGENSSNAGTLYFRNWTVEWNGCGETWPGEEPVGCWAQTAGGYGDGVGTLDTDGWWIIEDSQFRYNTSDGLDLLYATSNARIVIRRTHAEGNAGNQIKTASRTLIEETVMVSNCGYFEGQPFTHNVDPCRAGGNTLSLTLYPGQQASVVHTTLTGEGDCLVEVICDGACTGAEQARLRNSIFQGQSDHSDPTDQTCLVFAENFPHEVVDMRYSLITPDVKYDACPGPTNLCDTSAGLVDASLDTFDPRLTEGSPAIDAADFLTTTTTAGSGQTLPVAEAEYFSDGYGLHTGDTIQLEGSPQRAVVTDVDYDRHELTLDRSLTWDSGAGVSMAYQANAPDLGALEYGHSPTGRDERIEGPDTPALSKAYPNPFRASASFTLTVEHTQQVHIDLIDTLGRTVAVLYDGPIRAHVPRPFSINGTALPSGVYLYRANGENFREARKVILLR